MEVEEVGDRIDRNFDFEFLGVNIEELEILREFDDEALEDVNIVPIRPSILYNDQ